MYLAPAGAWARLRFGCLRKPPKAPLRLLGRGLSLRLRLPGLRLSPFDVVRT